MVEKSVQLPANEFRCPYSICQEDVELANPKTVAGGCNRRLLPVCRLDEDEKVLSPEELLYRCVHYINQTHDQVGTTLP